MFLDGVQRAVGLYNAGQYQPGDGRVIIGKQNADHDEGYASLEIDELAFFNARLSGAEILELYDMK